MLPSSSRVFARVSRVLHHIRPAAAAAAAAANSIFHRNKMTSTASSSSASASLAKPSLLLRSDVLEPKSSSSHKSTVIFSHGLGDESKSFVSMLKQIQESSLNSTRVVLTNAKVQPVTLNGGMKMQSWYDIYTFDRSSKLPDKEDDKGVASSAQEIESLIDYEINLLKQSSSTASSTSIPLSTESAAKSIFLAGFSQGAAMSLWCALTSSHRLGGAIVCSGYLLCHRRLSQLIKPANKSIPFFVYHGSDDQVVPLEYAQAGYDYLKREFGIEIKLHIEPHLPHSMSEDEIELMTQFIQSHLPNSNSNSIEK